MKILQLVSRRQRRGAEVFAADLSTSLARKGHHVSYVGLIDPPADPLSPDGCEVHDLSERGASKLSFSTLVRLVGFIRGSRPDLVQANGGYAMKYASLAKRAGRDSWPLLYCNIGLSSDWLRWPGQRALNRWLLGGATLTAAVSEAARRDLVETYGLNPARVEVVRRGVETDREVSRAEGTAALSLCGVPREADILMHVGSFTPEKNHGGLLRIFERVRESRPNSVLVLAGDGPLRSELEQRIADRTNVFTLGLRDDIPRLLAGADLLLLPSLTEGIPGVVLEAGAQSLATVAYDVGGVAEAVLDRETGRLVPPGDANGFARAVLELLDDPGERARLGRRANALVRERYSLEKSAEAFERLYLRLIDT